MTELSEGRIKFFNRDKDFGFLIPNNEGPDVHFRGSGVSANSGPLRKNAAATFRIVDDNGKPSAVDVKSFASVDHFSFSGLEKGRHLSQWAFIPFRNFTNDKGIDYRSALERLAELTLDSPEDWRFLSEADENDFPILESYLRYTFVRLWSEKKVAYGKDDRGWWASFNTGLVNRLYRPIYALFSDNSGSNCPWEFEAFCMPGIDFHGKKLIGLFDPLPPRAEYFSDPRDIFLDPSKEIFPQHDHIIEDGIRRGRFPLEFLARNKPYDFEWHDPNLMAIDDRLQFFGRLADAVAADEQCYRSIIARVDDAVKLAREKVRWNYKTAIPQYYPRHDDMSLLLPLSLVRDDKVDLALTVQRAPNGTYMGHTVIPLSWAYRNARLVCRPDSDWLTSQVDASNEDDVDEGTRSEPA